MRLELITADIFSGYNRIHQTLYYGKALNYITQQLRFNISEATRSHYMEQALLSEEKTILKLRTLYRRYGYLPYKMNRFEEYDLYVRNKDFLVSDSIITFTDTGGKLMALKPDVTLSIVKNSVEEKGFVEKVYYNENICRTPAPGKPFREIMQAGLECIGDIDDYCRAEVLLLAAESLREISSESLLAVSHVGIVSDVLDRMNVSASARAKLVQCIRAKNLHDAEKICAGEGVRPETYALLAGLMQTCGTQEEVFEKLFALLPNSTSLQELERIVRLLPKNSVRIDFSLVNDMHYYNGIVFQGFVSGVPDAVLSGGEYDLLMKKMGKRSKALGFAVYLDKLSVLLTDSPEYDVDVLLVYDESISPSAVTAKMADLISQEKTVSAQKSIPSAIRYHELIQLGGNNA